MTKFKVILAAFSITFALTYSKTAFSVETVYGLKNVTNHDTNFQEIVETRENRENTWELSIKPLIQNVNDYKGNINRLLEEINTLTDRNSIVELVYMKDIPWLKLIPGITNELVQETLMNTRAVPRFASLEDYIKKKIILKNRIKEIESMIKYKWPISRGTAISVMMEEEYEVLRLFLLEGWTFNEMEDLEFVKATFQRGRKSLPKEPNPYNRRCINMLKAAQALCQTMIRLNWIIPGAEADALEFLVFDKHMDNFEKTRCLKTLIKRPLGIEQKSAETISQMIHREQYDWAVLLIEKGWPFEIKDAERKAIRRCDHSKIKNLVFPNGGDFFPGVLNI